MYILFYLQSWPETFLILRRIRRDTIIYAHRSSRKVYFMIVRFLIKIEFFDRFSKNPQM